MRKPSPSASPQKPSQLKPRPCQSVSSLHVFWKSPTRQLAPVKRNVGALRQRTFEAQAAERLEEQEPTRVFFSAHVFLPFWLFTLLLPTCVLHQPIGGRNELVETLHGDKSYSTPPPHPPPPVLLLFPCTLSSDLDLFNFLLLLLFTEVIC